ncbi:MAG TPA: malto-oligosyltrehalose synthase [Gaiellaceae bacterium]|jgi:(1->4)-alpha-D-glucan 1-alpha-D-glucosylmutase|nr:malto-oligosyltrehalose synthase [Gaiellaceae bacterium]
MAARPELRATYRLQLGPSFGFREARELVPYVAALGVSHLYLSPVLQAREGSTHGYDVVDPRRVSEELGGEAALRELCRAGLGVIVDVVPNHMAAADENPFWSDPGLRRRFFDVDDATGRARRFFDVDELAGVRVEDPEVFATTHELILGLVRDGLVDGLRVDHIDGLADPRGYLERLRGAGVERVWVEKILESGEQLPDWPVEGTTGYEFAAEVQALFVDPAGESVLTELTGERSPFAEVAAAAKLERARTTFRPEVEWLRALYDHPLLEEALASLPVYRTYVEPWSGRVRDADREAVALLPDELRRVLALEERGHDEFVTRFQQTTGAVMAKGVEDTAFYRYVRLLALNEVGGDPGRFTFTAEELHRANAERERSHPHTLLAGTTHDTKRSADVRARIGVLSGMAERLAELARRWHALNDSLRRGGAPDWTEELFVYQTLLGAWPLSQERLEGYLGKAVHEEGRRTSWVRPNPEWDGAVAEFCRDILGHEAFLDEFVPFAAEVAAAGTQSAIGQLVLRLTCPGIPDVYGGDELWYLALVDPDNRRPIDWDRRRDLLAHLSAGGAPDRESVKLWVLRLLLDLRQRRPEEFEAGYEPLDAGAGTFAFRRGDLVVAVPVRGLEPQYDRPEGRWHDVLEGIAEPLCGYRPSVLVRA